MADTRSDVVIPVKQWVNLYAITGIVVGTAVTVMNKGSNPCLLVIRATAPPSTTMGAPLWPGPISNFTEVDAAQTGLWAYSEGGTSVLVQD